MRNILHIYNLFFLCIGLLAGVGYHVSITQAKEQGKIEMLASLPVEALMYIRIAKE